MGKKIGKKLVSLALLTCMILSLVGCEPLDAQEPDSSDNNGEAGNHASANYTVDLDATKLTAESEISDILYGIFFEDINFSVDAGVYAEMIKNRSFEYGSKAANGNRHSWVASNASVLGFSVVDGSADGTALNNVNPHYAVLRNSSSNTTAFEGIQGSGYLDGLAIEAEAKYIVSFYMKGIDSFQGNVRVALEDRGGNVYGEAFVDKKITDDWQKYEVILIAEATANKNLRLAVEITTGSVAVDMISMMPVETYEGLPIRKDIGEALAALNPSFIRFPGGCAVEGRDKASQYNWKDSIGNGIEFVVNGVTTVGDVAVRPQGEDIWSGTTDHPYYTTYGIGFYEYFALCDVLDALPIPILNAGMTCPIQSSNYQVYDINSEEFKQCVQDALDLVEFCRGDASTYWGSVRIAMGHEEPFELKYIGIGNEQWQTEYHQHYKKFVEAFEQAARQNPSMYGDIELIVANGPVSTDKYGYNYVASNPDNITTLVDEHYYEVAEWFYKNTNRYDNYDRDMQAAVFLGEYAAKANTMNAALAEAAFMTGLERNADIVKMACYAPLFGNSTFSQWTPDMIFFSNDSLMLTPNYYVQKLFANNVGVNILPSSLEVGEIASGDSYHGKIGLGSWATSVSYDDLKVTSNADGSVLYECDFSSDSVLTDDNWEKLKGKWSISGGGLVQSSTATPSTNYGDVMYVGDTNWSNYTLTVKGTILGGNEGFLIPICVDDKNNNIFWNLGGWNNTVSCLEIIDNGVKSGQVSGTVRTVKLNKNQEYEIKIVVEDSRIRCYLNDRLYVDYQPEQPEPLYETASIDANGDIILKFVNTTSSTIDINVSLANLNLSQYNTKASVTALASDSLSATNTFENPDLITPVDSTITVDTTFVYEAPSYSVSIIRIPHK